MWESCHDEEEYKRVKELYPMYRIIRVLHNQWKCECDIQDGTERWQESSRESAVHSLIAAARTLNGSYIREDDIEIIDVNPLISTRTVSFAQQKLLDEIQSGQKVVLDFDDKRIKYRLTNEECDWIIQRREGKLCGQ